MFYIGLVMLAISMTCIGCNNSSTISPGEFTNEFSEELRKSSSGIKVEIIRDMELKITDARRKEYGSYLGNAYDCYMQDPKNKKEIIRKYVCSFLETVGTAADGIDRARIVPIIKDRLWLEETRQAMMDRGAKKVPEWVFDDFNSDLVIVYAQDALKNIRYITPDDLQEVKIERQELRSLACENLKKILPKIECHGANGLFMMTAGGDYEASLLLFDSLWDEKQIKIQGDVIAAIPTRDVLLITGTGHPEQINIMDGLVKKSYKEGSYRLTPKLFVRKNKKYEEYIRTTLPVTSK